MTDCPLCGNDLLGSTEPAEPSQLVGCSSCLNPSIIRWDHKQPVVERIEGVKRVNEMAPPGSVMNGAFKLLPDSIAEMPVSVEIPQRILSLLHDPLTSMGDLAKIINEDATISMKVLRIANSAYFASVQEITDLQTACSRLGMKTIANIAAAVTNGNLYRVGNPVFKELMQQLWRHGVATAFIAERLADTVPDNDPSMCFIGGLVHDSGKLVLLDILSTKYKGSIGRLGESPELMIKVMNDNYAPVGLLVVQYWRMPPELLSSTFFHGTPDLNPEPTSMSLTHVISLASDLAEACGYGIGTESPIEVAGHPSAQALGISDADLQRLKEELPEQIDSFVDVLRAT